MFKPRLWTGLALLAALSLLLAACGGGATTAAPTQVAPTAGPTLAPEATTVAPPTPAPAGATEGAPKATTAPGPAFVSKPSGKTAASGFVCPEPQPRMEVTSKEVNLFVWTEYIPQDIIDCFQLVYGVTVNRDEYSANEDMYAKLSKGVATYDIVQPTNNFVSLMIRQNMIQKLDKTKLSIMGYFDAQYIGLAYDPNNDYTVPYEAGTDAIVYNASVVKDPPQSWSDLWKPEYAGMNMVMLDGAHDILGAVLLSLGYDVNTKDPKQLEAAKAKMLQLAPSIKLYDSDSPKTALIGGDVALGITWTGEAVLAAREKPEIKYVYPQEGAILWQDNYAIPTGAPHLDAAYAWLNYSMQPDLFWLMLRDFPYTNPNRAALDYAKDNQPDLYKPYIDSPVTNTPPDAVKAGHWLDDLGDAAPLYDKIWTEVKGG